MKKLLLALFTLLLAGMLTACSGDEDASETENPAEEPATEEDEAGADEAEKEEAESGEGKGGFLWKVESGDTEMYLQGTIHLGTDDFYPLDPAIEEAFDSADVVLPEFNLLEEMPAQEEVLEYAMLEEGTTLEDELSDETYEELASIFEENGLDLETMNEFQPWFVEMMLLEFTTMSSDVDSQEAVDLYFLEKATEDEKEIISLESAEEQFEVLSGYSMETQIQTLELAIDGYEEAPEEMEELAEAWLEGDIEAMETMSDDYGEAGINAEYMEELNDNRNIDMANSLDDILQEDSGQVYFVFVGTAHFTVEPSIITELEDKGYEVEHVY
ncbi:MULTISPECIES: TraB/GumN family protein [Oceanobacillus]|uniref:TraB/GumN family protein n=1 Tax=Oceanobacillus aidingensis TaxID=645964 RepID=A0ABV9JZM9_9BACI|nr:TraB/GumN family protein [Oceanobacillus oncorhynchi]MDM8098571.1 TraB/GumN family protein [Oceanobacillus oncorhynchi]UUI39027.1 TraB/GumN family protein [Oceanobacillus oncorhynchi]